MEQDKIAEAGWEKEFDLAFDTPHSQMTHIGGKVKSRDCDVCKESREKNPRRYSKTFLTESNSYWNDALYQDVKSFIRITLRTSNLQLIERVEREIEAIALEAGDGMWTQGQVTDEIRCRASSLKQELEGK